MRFVRALVDRAQPGVVARLRSDVTAAGQRSRVLSVVDGFIKQSLVLETDTSFPSRRVTRTLERTIRERGLPQAIRCDNGPETTRDERSPHGSGTATSSVRTAR